MTSSRNCHAVSIGLCCVVYGYMGHCPRVTLPDKVLIIIIIESIQLRTSRRKLLPNNNAFTMAQSLS